MHAIAGSESAFDAPLFPTHSSQVCCQERAGWGRQNWVCPPGAGNPRYATAQRLVRRLSELTLPCCPETQLSLVVRISTLLLTTPFCWRQQVRPFPFGQIILFQYCSINWYFCLVFWSYFRFRLFLLVFVQVSVSFILHFTGVLCSVCK